MECTYCNILAHRREMVNLVGDDWFAFGVEIERDRQQHIESGLCGLKNSLKSKTEENKHARDLRA